MTRLIPLLLAAVVLAACGGTSSSRSADGAYRQVEDAATAMAAKGPTYALVIQDCTATARGAADAAACGRQLLQRLRGDFAPVQAAITALDGVADGACTAAVRKAVADAPLLAGTDPAPLTDLQQAEALGNQVTDQLLQFSQEIAQAGSACG